MIRLKHKIKFLNAVCGALLVVTLGAILPGCLGHSTDQGQLPPHPRLILTPSHVDQVKARLSSSELMQELHAFQLAMADTLEAAPLITYQKTGRRLLGTSRHYLKRMLYLGYAYQLTGDKKYAIKAEKEMVTAAGFESWNPSHFLDVAEMTTALSIGYDWCYPALSDAAKAKIRTAIFEKGIRPSFIEPKHWWHTTDNNWGQVCHTGMAFGAWAIYEHWPDTAQLVIDRSRAGIRVPASAYAPSGAYPEGPMYWEYGTSYHALFIDAHETLYGDTHPLEVSEAFESTADFFLHVHGPAAAFNWGDGGPRHYFSATQFWFAQRQRDTALLYLQMPLLRDILDGKRTLKALSHGQRLFPMTITWLSRLEGDGVEVPSQRSWFAGGKCPVAFHRTSWAPGGMFLAVKGGSANVSHAHMDAGQFVLDAHGIRWAYDLGGHNYEALEKEGLDIWGKHQQSDRWKIFRYNNKSHNTLVVNGQLQRVEGKCEIIENIVSPGYRASKVDMTPAFRHQLDSVVRTVAIVGEDHFLIKDYLQNLDTAASNVRWAFLTYDSIKFLSSRMATIHKEDHLMQVEIKQPVGSRLQTYSAQPDLLPYEPPNEGFVMLGFELELEPGASETLEIHLTPAKK